jgi:hypothetical protein
MTLRIRHWSLGFGDLPKLQDGVEAAKALPGRPFEELALSHKIQGHCNVLIDTAQTPNLLIGGQKGRNIRVALEGNPS